MPEERLVRLVYELLDALDDTARIASVLGFEERWRIHLDYLRDLQRLGREILAGVTVGGV
jgi:hypothetical protein